MSRYPDIAPTISVDTDYGKYVGLIDFNVQAITNHLREGGLSDQEILDTTIVFSDTHPEEGVANTHTLGRYFDRNKTAVVYANYHAFLTYMNNAGADAHVDNIANRLLNHELEHRIAAKDQEQQRHNTRYRRQQAGYRIGSLAIGTTAGSIAAGVFTDMPVLTSIAVGATIPAIALNKLYKRGSAIHRRYLDHPEEQRCRQAERQGPRLVYIATKPFEFRISKDTTREAIEAQLQEVEHDYYATVAEQKAEAERELANAQLERLNAVIAFMLRLQSGEFEK